MSKFTVRAEARIFLIATVLALIIFIVTVFFFTQLVSGELSQHRQRYLNDLLNVLVSEGDIEENIRLFRQNYPHFELEEKALVIFDPSGKVLYQTGLSRDYELPRDDAIAFFTETQKKDSQLEVSITPWNNRFHIGNRQTRRVLFYLNTTRNSVADLLRIVLLTSFVAALCCLIVALLIFVTNLRRKVSEIDVILENMDWTNEKYVESTLVDRLSGGDHVINQILQNLYRALQSRETAIQSKVDLLSQLAHDIRTPLTSIRTATDTLYQVEGTIDSEQKKKLHEIVQLDVNYLTKLVDDLVFLAILDREVTEEEPTAPLGHLLEEISKKYRTHGSERIRSQIVFQVEDLNQAKANELEFLRLITNILDNAFESAVSFVQFEAKIENGSLLIHSSNDCHKLTDEDVQFFGKKRLQRKINFSNQNSSVGLGSVIITSIVNKWNGELKVSRNPEAQTFSLDLELPI